MPFGGGVAGLGPPLAWQVALLVDRLVGDRTKEFARWLAPPGHHSIGTPKIVALDLDDTIWNTDLWIAELRDELIEPVLAEHMPKAYVDWMAVSPANVYFLEL
jgi:hypothetical protein